MKARKEIKKCKACGNDKLLKVYTNINNKVRLKCQDCGTIN